MWKSILSRASHHFVRSGIDTICNKMEWKTKARKNWILRTFNSDYNHLYQDGKISNLRPSQCNLDLITKLHYIIFKLQKLNLLKTKMPSHFKRRHFDVCRPPCTIFELFYWWFEKFGKYCCVELNTYALDKNIRL